MAISIDPRAGGCQSRETPGCQASLHLRVFIPQPTEWQRIGNQIDAAMIFARTDFVSVQRNMLLLALRFVSFAHHVQVRFTLPELG